MNIKENGVNVIWMVVNICQHHLTEILAYIKALKVKISVHSNFPYSFTHSELLRMKECSGKKVLIVKVAQNDPLNSSSQKIDQVDSEIKDVR